MEVYYNREEFGVLSNYETLIERVVESLLEQGKIHCQHSKLSKSKKKQNGIDKINTHALLTIVLTAFPPKTETTPTASSKLDQHGQHHHESTQSFTANKKIAELLGPVDNSVVNIIFDKSYLPEKYKPISSMEKLRKAYEEVYEKILKKQPQLIAYKKEDDEDEDEEDYEENGQDEVEEDEEEQGVNGEMKSPRKKLKGNSEQQ